MRVKFVSRQRPPFALPFTLPFFLKQQLAFGQTIDPFPYCQHNLPSLACPPTPSYSKRVIFYLAWRPSADQGIFAYIFHVSVLIFSLSVFTQIFYAFAIGTPVRFSLNIFTRRVLTLRLQLQPSNLDPQSIFTGSLVYCRLNFLS